MNARAILPALLLGSLLPAACSRGGGGDSGIPLGPAFAQPGLFAAPVRQEVLQDAAEGSELVDVNGDGALDLVTLSSSDLTLDGRITVVPGRRGGGFGVARTLDGLGFVEAWALGDLDGDRRADLVAASFEDGLRVFRQRGDGTFAPPRFLPASGAPGALRLADLDGDGRPDLVLDHVDTVGVLRNRGGGRFDGELEVDVPPGSRTGTGRLLVARFDADEHPDVLVLSRDLVVFRGRGDGTLAEGEAFPLGLEELSDARVADLQGDARDEVAVFSATARTLTVLAVDDTDGVVPVFEAEVPGLLRLTSGGYVRVARLDGDELPDLALLDEDGVHVFLGRAASGFVGLPEQLFGHDVVGFDLADTDGDGHADLVAAVGHLRALRSTTSMAVFRGLGDGRFAGPERYPTLADVRGLAVADFDQDLVPDVLALGDGPDPELAFLAGRGDGTLAPAATSQAGATGSSLATGDVNGNTLVDLVLVDRDLDRTGHLSVLASRGDGTFDPPETRPTDGLSPTAVEVADLDGDDVQDLVLVQSDSGALTWFTGLGGGAFAPPAHVPAGTAPADLALADLDRDGLLDAVVTEPLTVRLLRGSASGGFEAARIVEGVPAPAGSARAADLDLDGHADLLLVASGLFGFAPGLLFLPGRGDGTFGEPVSAAGFPAGQAWLTELDGDGLPDVVVAPFRDQIAYALGNGDGTFGRATFLIAPLGGFPGFADLDGDGAEDVVFAVATTFGGAPAEALPLLVFRNLGEGSGAGR